MSQTRNHSQVTIGIERRRREAAVKVGRQQVFFMEEERKLESEERKIQTLLRRNHELGSLLKEIEKENGEEHQEAGVEVARRQKVVKLWRLQVKLMERERKLEKLLAPVVKVRSTVGKQQDGLEQVNQLLVHAHSEDVLRTVEDIDLSLRPISSSVLDSLPSSLRNRFRRRKRRLRP